MKQESIQYMLDLHTRLCCSNMAPVVPGQRDLAISDPVARNDLAALLLTEPLTNQEYQFTLSLGENRDSILDLCITKFLNNLLKLVGPRMIDANGSLVLSVQPPHPGAIHNYFHSILFSTLCDLSRKEKLCVPCSFTEDDIPDAACAEDLFDSHEMRCGFERSMAYMLSRSPQTALFILYRMSGWCVPREIAAQLSQFPSPRAAVSYIIPLFLQQHPFLDCGSGWAAELYDRVGNRWNAPLSAKYISNSINKTMNSLTGLQAA